MNKRVWYHPMSDKKNDIDTDFEEKLAEIADKKSRNRTNNKIYERFISRVQSGGDADSDETEYVKLLDSAEKLFAYEPLSTNELELFANQDSDDAEQLLAMGTTTTTNAVFDFSDQETAMSELSLKTSSEKEAQSIGESLQSDHSDDDIFNSDSEDDFDQNNKTTVPSDITETMPTFNDDVLVTEESAIQSLTKEKAASLNKVANSKKPLIIGMIFGSLSIAIIFMILIFTGVLSTSADSVQADADTNVNSRIDATVAADSMPVATPAQATNLDADIIEKPIVVVPQQDIQDNLANESQGEGATTTNEAAPKVLPTEPTITYEDFREESQSTLYRETDN